MPNKNYEKGRRKEYSVVHRLRDRGYIAFRSAGSHAPVDVVGIHQKNKRILLVQCKLDNMSERAKQNLEELNEDMNVTFEFRFVVI